MEDPKIERGVYSPIKKNKKIEEIHTKGRKWVKQVTSPLNVPYKAVIESK
jgi:hypothetical protein